jgi:SLOG in TRPM, prokaryote/SMODS and SLOG-associating 2TM effector domain 1/Protein of unknown function (DUF4231)
MPSPDKRLIDLSATDTIDSIIAQIKSEPRPLIILLGDYDVSLDPTVKSLCSRAIVPAAVSSGAVIVDNGANSGCSALVGQAARDEDRGSPPTLLGIAIHSVGEPEPNHTVIVRLPAEWSDPMKALVQIAGELVKDKTAGDKPILTVLFGGGKTEKEAVVRCVRREWPVLVVQGSGGIADEILKGMEPMADGQLPAMVADPDLREIIETGDIYKFSIPGSVDDLNRILLARIDLRVETLADAWNRYEDLDKAAIRKQVLFKNLQLAILGLGLIATLLAISRSGSALPLWLKQLFPVQFASAFQTLMHILIVLTPITISILVAANSRFREGNKWILLRAASEAIKREIFSYRMRAGAYSNEQCLQVSRESKLAAKLKDISSALVQSEVNQTSVPAVLENDPASLTFLSPDDYLKNRINDQIDYFVTKTASLSKRLKKMQVWIYIAGGVGTALAAFHGDVWVALTTAVAATLTTRLETDQVEHTLIQYNQALTGLRNIASWWRALSQWEKGRRRNIDLLVEQTETTLEGELAGWVQQMQSALDKLTEKQQAAAGINKAAAAKA